jgi:hypothetical protein
MELPFGIDTKTPKWTDGYETRSAPRTGFSHSDNKAKLVAIWLLAMSTGNQIYKERAEKWFRLMKRRMMLNEDHIYKIWKR